MIAAPLERPANATPESFGLSLNLKPCDHRCSCTSSSQLHMPAELLQASTSVLLVSQIIFHPRHSLEAAAASPGETPRKLQIGRRRGIKVWTCLLHTSATWQTVILHTSCFDYDLLVSGLILESCSPCSLLGSYFYKLEMEGETSNLTDVPLTGRTSDLRCSVTSSPHSGFTLSVK